MEISGEFDKSNKVIFVKVLMTYWHFAKVHLLLTNKVQDIISHSNFLSISRQIKATERAPDAKWPSWSEYFSL